MEKVIFFTILVALMVVGMPFLKRFPKKIRRPMQLATFAVYLLGNLYVTLLSREASPIVRMETVLLSAYRASFDLDYGVLGTLKHLIAEGFPAGIRLVNTEPLEGILLNILLYIPMGYLLPLLFPRLKGRHVLMLGFAASLLTETTQLISHLGMFDVDDLINNTLGVIIGLLLFFLFLKEKPRRRRV
jgi:glycopeptide antibiotics resistance protein